MAMRSFGRTYRDRLAIAAALGLPVAIATVLLPWRGSLPNTDVALVLVAAVVAVAANGHRGAGVLTAAGCALWFDFFWTQPYERFTITRGSDIGTTVLLLAVGAAVSELAARGRRARRVVATDSAYLAAISAATDMAASGTDSADLIGQVQAQLTAILGLRAARFEQGTFLGRPPRLDENGNLQWASTRWNLEEHGFPDSEIELRTRGAGRDVGRFMLTPTPGTVPSRDARRVAVILADQVGIALASRRADTPHPQAPSSSG